MLLDVDLKMKLYYASCFTFLLQDIINNMHFVLVKMCEFQTKMQSKIHWNECGRIMVMIISAQNVFKYNNNHTVQERAQHYL